MAQTHITVDLPVQADGVLPNTQLALATATDPGAVLPDGSTISLNLGTGEIATAGIDAVITTAALTLAGTQGSMTFVKGVLTAQVPAT